MIALSSNPRNCCKMYSCYMLQASALDYRLQHLTSSNTMETGWSTVADLGFHEGGFIRLGALAHPRKFFENHAHFWPKTMPFYVVEQYPRC